MYERTARTARGNRIGLGLFGIILLAGGGYLVSRSLRAFGQQEAADPVYATRTVDWVHNQRPWLWLTITAISVIAVVLLVRWLLVQLRSDSLNRIAVDIEQDDDRGFGRTDLPANALAAAVGQEIENYPGVSRVHAGVTGRPDRPALRLTVSVDPAADLARVRSRITGEAIENARVALDAQHLPTLLQLAVGRRERPRRNEI